MTQILTSTTIDVRSIEPRERHATVFATFGALAPGEVLEIVSDHDPKPLYFQFQAKAPGQFSWDYLESGPAAWRVSVVKLARAHGAGGCCGGCGGGA